MDRLYPLGSVAILAGLLMACDSAPPVAGPSRVVAVAAEQKTAPDDALAGFCDLSGDTALGHAFNVPATTGKSGEAKGKRWVNIWASWCKPCLEEMPRLVQWQRQLAKDGADVALRFVSADNDPEAFDGFMTSHPELPASELLEDPTALTSWLSELGLDPGAGLPVHALLDSQGLRCVRAGAVTDKHYDVIAQVFTR